MLWDVHLSEKVGGGRKSLSLAETEPCHGSCLQEGIPCPEPRPASPPPNWAQSAAAYPVENFSPALHGDALVDSEHCKAEVIEVGDAVVGPWPATAALGAVDGAVSPVAGAGARGWLL